jgi:hypothetical protein
MQYPAPRSNRNKYSYLCCFDNSRMIPSFPTCQIRNNLYKWDKWPLAVQNHIIRPSSKPSFFLLSKSEKNIDETSILALSKRFRVN